MIPHQAQLAGTLAVLACVGSSACRADTVETPSGSAAGGTVLELDWNTGEFTDGGLLVDWSYTAPQGMEVRSTPEDGRDFSTSRYVRISSVNGNGWIDAISGTWAAPQPGQTITATWEMRWVTAVSGQTTHGFYFDDDFDGVNWGPQTLGLSIEDQGNNWQVGLWTAESASPSPWGWRTPQSYLLNKGERYDFALSYTRTGQTTFRVGITISQTGAVVLDASDFVDVYNEVSGTLADQEFTQSGAGAQGMRGFRLGNNGLDNPFEGPILEVANVRVILEG
ncbi:MAG: hypothetical protein PVF69_03410 [Gemmatimonadota bacterium]|jgi:hypothetical protein